MICNVNNGTLSISYIYHVQIHLHEALIICLVKAIVLVFIENFEF